MKSTTKATFATDVLQSKKPVLLDVWASYCGPCRVMMPIVDEIASEMAATVDVVKLDAGEEMDMAQELGVSGLPTFLVFKNGQIVDSIAGMTSKAKLVEMLQKNI